jgi:hypothetical protein
MKKICIFIFFYSYLFSNSAIASFFCLIIVNDKVTYILCKNLLQFLKSHADILNILS